MKLIRLFSDDNSFREITFHGGINLICGEKSVDDSGNITSNKQNGVGKSLAIELINFCLLKKSDYSRVSEIPDEILSHDSFVNLHFQHNDKNYIISRNKSGKIKIKDDKSDFVNYKNQEDAMKELNNIFNFTGLPISVREYINFVIKEENYNYRDFAEYFKSNYADILKIHFYFFGLPITPLNIIKQLFEKCEHALATLRKINKDLKSRDLDINKLKAFKNELQTQIEEAENGLEYHDVIKNIENESDQIVPKENELNSLLMKKKQYQIELLEITDFAQIFSDDFYIDDKDIEVVFNKYKKGLGSFIKKDLKSLKAFKEQILEFKTNLLVERKSNLVKNILEIDQKIADKQNDINLYYKDIVDTKSSNLVKNLRIYKQKYSKLEKYISDIVAYEEAEMQKEDSKSEFNENIKEIITVWRNTEENRDSFKKTFTDIHKSIMGSSECNFDIKIQNTFKIKSFFTFDVFVEGQGSKGVNQMQSVIYDISLLNNEYTSVKHLGMIVHDNLIFGSVDKDSSIKTLNYLSSLDPNNYQYIATVNKDDFSYKELENYFNFDKDESVVIELTRELPLFPLWKMSIK
ncbi:MAG: DUF2326 domain-containing protein [Microgenomates group bacterium]